MSFIARARTSLFAGLAFIGGPVLATSGDRFSVGAMGQLDVGRLSDLPAQPVVGFHHATGPGGGVLASLALNERVSLEARALLVQKGSRLLATAAEGEATLSFRYLAVPLLLKVSGRGRVRPYALLGAELGLRTGARVRSRMAGGQELEADLSELVAATDAALDFGGGLERIGDRLSLFGEAVYSLGIKNVNRDPEVTLRTRTLLLGVGVRF